MMYVGSTVLRRSTSKAAVRLSISIVGKGSSPGIPLQCNIIADSARTHLNVNGGNRPGAVAREVVDERL